MVGKKALGSYISELEDTIEEGERFIQRLEQLKNRMKVGYERTRRVRKKKRRQ